MTRGPVRLLGLVLLLLGAAGPARSGDGDRLEDLAAGLAAATRPEEVSALLDRAGALVGTPALPDAGAFGDWLGGLAPAVRDRPLVRLRQGWAWLAAGRAAEALGALERAEAAGAERGVLLAYRGEALRQTGEPDRAVDALVGAAEAGYADPFLGDAMARLAFELRRDRMKPEAEDLPDYAQAFDRFLTARFDAALAATAARWMLDDHAAYAIEDRPRFRRWAAFAGRHARRALAADPTIAGGARLALDAARALEPEDLETDGRTPRFDLLAWAYRLGRRPDQATHDLPEAIVRLAEAALREGRWRLARRLADERLQISESPAARRVLAALPPDVQDEG